MRFSGDVPPIKSPLASLAIILCILASCSSAGQQSKDPAEGGVEQTTIPSRPSAEPAANEEDKEALPGYAKLR